MSVENIDNFSIEMKCPLCKSEETIVTQKILEIPHFSRVWLFHLKCKSCGFKHNDMLNLDIKEPTRHIYHAENEDDYTSKIIRSANGTIRIPNIGAIIEPGPSATGFINNIEGVLQDIRDKARFLLRDAETVEERDRIMEYIKTLDDYIEKSLPLDFIIEDPFGNSMIIPFDEKKMETQQLSEEEVAELKTGYIMFSTSKNG
ncbi:MAG: ZPR1 zinc finger domain-containing protein [Candidatus Heimdallarchaeaceae archaeon]